MIKVCYFLHWADVDLTLINEYLAYFLSLMAWIQKQILGWITWLKKLRKWHQVGENNKNESILGENPPF